MSLRDKIQKRTPKKARFTSSKKPTEFSTGEMKKHILQSIQYSVKEEFAAVMDSEIDKILNEMVDEKIDQMVKSGTKGDTGDKGIDGKDADEQKIVAKVLKMIRQPKDGKDADEKKVVKEVLKLIPPPKEPITYGEVEEIISQEIGKIKEPKTLKEKDILKIVAKVQKEFNIEENAPKIARALEDLKGRAKLDYYALKNLPTIPTEGEGKKTIHRGGQGLAVYAHAITGDGTRSYTVPVHTRAILLTGSDFPYTYHLTTDYTTSGVTLTIDSAVDAPSVGASLVFVYAK